MIPVVIALVLAGAAAWFLVPFIWRKLEERRLTRLCRRHRMIVLTYDDGPGPELTPQILDLLKRFEVYATFFLLGKHAQLRPELAQRVIAEGHEVGSHTQDHSNAWKATPFRASRDRAAGVRTVLSLGGDGHLFRPPFGKLTLWGLIEGALRRTRYAWWTVDSRDSWARRPVEAVLSEIEAKGGGIVLMHDYDEYAGQVGGIRHVDHVLDLTRRILEFAKAHNYSVARLSELQAGGEAGRHEKHS